MAPLTRPDPRHDTKTPANRERGHGLYPALPPRVSGMLPVSGGHTLYYEESGNPNGKPAVVLHGGPGSGSNPTLRRFHDPDVYRIILFDQRGCGRSAPHAMLEHNTTWDLVDDIERLREHLGITRWQVFGGSWGSTLALAYAQTHPTRVTELVLRGIFLMRRSEIDWFYIKGCNTLFPDAYEQFIAPIPEDERGDVLHAFHRRLTGTDRAAQLEAARAWSRWEGRTLSMREDSGRVRAFGSEAYAIAFARIECHYFVNRGFLSHDNALLDGMDAVRHIPTRVVQGRYDVITPMKNAWDLLTAFPEAELTIVEGAGHAVTEPGVIEALRAATDHYALR